ncbi:MAG TPA: helix-turn-helix domain-containing protein, partial [Longimicrobiaceae bacterium]|nr:helix-turn-helix domain-containing protein [Longimicrobiaceae bacterium]
APSALAVVDPLGPGEGPPSLSEELRDLLRLFPSATVLAAVPATGGVAGLLPTLFEWGVADVVDLLRETTPAAFARRLDAVRSRRVQRLLRRALPGTVPSRTRSLLSVAADVVAAGGLATELAAALGVDERTVPRWCQRADLPPPRRLLAWLRLLLAADLLDEPSRSVESVARACGYAGGGSLKSALLNFFGLTPQELRERGAFESAAHAFARELFELRERSRERGRPEKTWLN